MGRPERQKRICAEPNYDRFCPIGQASSDVPITLSIEEYETIRWIDLEGNSREECAAHMDIARTTAQAIYNSARAKIAECIVNGRELRIAGGTVRFCDGSSGCTPCRKYRQNVENCQTLEQITKKEQEIMRVAVPYENGEIFQHFGKTAFFKLYDIAEKQVQQAEVYSTNGTGHGALAGLLQQAGVNVVLCGGIGGGAMQALERAGIAVVAGASGAADAAVESWLAGTLVAGTPGCQHHDAGAGHDCKGHSCGAHHCGEGR